MPVPENSHGSQLHSSKEAIKINYQEELEKLVENSPAKETKIKVAENIAIAAKIQAATSIAAMQKAMIRKSDDDIVRIFATGDTQYLGYQQEINMLSNWDDLDPIDRKILLDNGVDLNSKPDMTRVVAMNLDSIFPQSRDAHYSYANILEHYFDALGIEKEKRFLMYGDVKIPKEGAAEILDSSKNQMSPDELNAVLESTKTEGLLVKEFQNSTLRSDHIQYSFLNAMHTFAQQMSNQLTVLGGPDIVHFSVGHSYEGTGHIAFIESGRNIKDNAFIEHLSYSAAAGNFKSNGGIHNFWAKNGSIAYGSVSYGPADLVKDHTELINVVNRKSKTPTVSRYLNESLKDDGKLVYPVLALGHNRGEKHTLIVDNAVAEELIRLNSPTKTKVENLLPSTAEEILNKLNINQGDNILNFLPHLDDLSLAALKIMKAIPEREANLISHCSNQGSSAVNNPYALSILEGATQISKERQATLAQQASNPENFKKAEQKLLEELVEELKDTKRNHEPTNYEVFNDFSSTEARLRAELLTLRFAKLHPNIAEKIRAGTDNVMESIHQTVAEYEAKQPAWGSKDLKMMQDIKVAIRMTEEQTQQMSAGVAYDGIHWPTKTSWYNGGFEHTGTVAKSDIQKFKKIILEKRPSCIILNGEGFMDHGAHCMNEMAVKLALLEIYEEGELDGELSIFEYRGVWDRTPVTDQENQVLLSLDSNDLTQISAEFKIHYPSQCPASVPDPAISEPGFFSDRVLTNAKTTLEEYRLLGGESDSAGILAFNIHTNIAKDHAFFEKIKRMEKELKEVAVPIKEGKLSQIIGSAPSPDLSESELIQKNSMSELFFTKNELRLCKLAS